MKIVIEEKVYEELVEENIKLKKEVADLKNQLNQALEQIKLLTSQKYGKSTEKVDIDDSINEAEVLNDQIEDVELEEIRYFRRKNKVSRLKKLEEFPRETIEYHLTDDECNCFICKKDKFKEMSRDTRLEFIYIPAEFKVIEHVVIIYSCDYCNEYGENATIIKAPSKNALIPKSIASASLVAYILYEKYVMASPLYRIEKHFSGIDVMLSRQVMASWVIKVAQNHLKKIYDLMKEILLKKEVIYSDDTGIQVLKEEGKLASSKSYMWFYITIIEEKICLLEYTKTRARKHPTKFLKGFEGYIHVDGYAAYEKIESLTLIGCFAHARRKFYDALKTLPKTKRTPEVASVIGFKYCNKLFKIENQIIEEIEKEYRENYERFKKPVIDKIYNLRLKYSVPILDDFKKWLDLTHPTAAPKSLLGGAITYCLNQWEKLIGFTLDGRLELSNNLSERTVKNFVMGRRNWLFADTPSGATSSAIIYSVSETAKLNNLNVYKYFDYLLSELPNIEDKDIVKLLPWSDHLPPHIKLKSVVKNE